MTPHENKHRRLFGQNNRISIDFVSLSAMIRNYLMSIAMFLCLLLITGTGYAENTPQKQFSSQINHYFEETQLTFFNYVPTKDVEFSLKQTLEQISPPICGGAYQFEWRGNPGPGNNTLKAICENSSWQRYISVNVKVFKFVVVSNKPLTRGMVIEASFLQLRRADISQLRLGYFESIAEVTGFNLQRTLKSGQVLTPFIAKAPDVVKRGDWVSVSSGKGALLISTTGEAMKNGKIGDQIPVKNLKSKTIFRAWIIKKGVVSTRQDDL